MHRPLVLLLQRVPHILNAVQAGRSLALPLSKISHSTLTHHSSAAATRAHQRTETRTHTRHGTRHASTTASSSTVAPPFVRSPRTVATASAPSPPHTRSHTAQPRAQRPQHNTSPGPTTSTAPVQRAPSSSRAAFLHTHASARASPAVIRNGVRPCVLGVCVCVRVCSHAFIHTEEPSVCGGVLVSRVPIVSRPRCECTRRRRQVGVFSESRGVVLWRREQVN